MRLDFLPRKFNWLSQSLLSKAYLNFSVSYQHRKHSSPNDNSLRVFEIYYHTILGTNSHEVDQHYGPGVTTDLSGTIHMSKNRSLHEQRAIPQPDMKPILGHSYFFDNIINKLMSIQQSSLRFRLLKFMVTDCCNAGKFMLTC